MPQAASFRLAFGMLRLGFCWLTCNRQHFVMTVYSLQPSFWNAAASQYAPHSPVKLCQLCNEHKPLIAFPSQPRNKDNLDSRCRMCIRQHSALRSRLKKQFPRPSPGPCPICSKHTEQWVLDHCHTTDQFRGYICSSCNLGLGHFDDSPALVQSALNYLLGINT